MVCKGLIVAKKSENNASGIWVSDTVEIKAWRVNILQRR